MKSEIYASIYPHSGIGYIDGNGFHACEMTEAEKLSFPGRCQADKTNGKRGARCQRKAWRFHMSLRKALCLVHAI
jgi:hypothetical protein